MDLVFLFWVITEGIACGTGMAMVSVILILVAMIGVFLLQRFLLSMTMKIMIISASNYQYEDAVMQVIKEHCKHFKVKSRTFSTGQLNLVLEFASED